MIPYHMNSLTTRPTIFGSICVAFSTTLGVSLMVSFYNTLVWGDFFAIMMPPFHSINHC